MKKNFSGYLSAYSPATKDNVPYVKFSIKTTETGADKHLLYGIEKLDSAFSNAKSFTSSKGYGNTKYDLDDPLHVKVVFGAFTYEAYLVSLSVKKKVDKEVGDVAEYTFNLEKDPNDDDTKFWSSYLKVKETEPKEDEEGEDGEVSPVDAAIMEQTDAVLGLDESEQKKKKKSSGFVLYAVSIETISDESSDEDADAADTQEEA